MLKCNDPRIIFVEVGKLKLMQVLDCASEERQIIVVVMVASVPSLNLSQIHHWVTG